MCAIQHQDAGAVFTASAGWHCLPDDHPGAACWKRDQNDAHANRAFKLPLGDADVLTGETAMVGAIDQSLGGISRGFDRLEQSADRIASDGAGGDLAGNIVGSVIARQEVRANVAAVRTADQMLGSLLDVMA